MWGDKYMSKDIQIIHYDTEWIQLIRKAKDMGLTPAEVRVLIKKVEKSSQYTS